MYYVTNLFLLLVQVFASVFIRGHVIQGTALTASSYCYLCAVSPVSCVGYPGPTGLS
jgi:hypothetical protein